jgi:hypothetical protein
MHEWLIAITNGTVLVIDAMVLVIIAIGTIQAFVLEIDMVSRDIGWRTCSHSGVNSCCGINRGLSQGARNNYDWSAASGGI